MKYLQLLLTALFFFFAALQFNDPDPIAWISIYSFTGGMAFLTATGEKRPFLSYALITGLAICGLWMIILSSGFIHWIEAGAPTILSGWEEGNPSIERTREFLGLLICMSALGYDLFLYTKKAYHPMAVARPQVIHS